MLNAHKMEVKNAWRYISNPSYTSTAHEFFLLHRNAFRDCMVTSGATWPIMPQIHWRLSQGRYGQKWGNNRTNTTWTWI